VARTIDTELGDARAVLDALATAGVDMDDVGRALEVQGVAAFEASVAHVLAVLEARSPTAAARKIDTPGGRP